MGTRRRVAPSDKLVGFYRTYAPGTFPTLDDAVAHTIALAKDGPIQLRQIAVNERQTGIDGAGFMHVALTGVQAKHLEG